MRTRQKPGLVKAESLTLQANTISLDDELSAAAAVKDGLAAIENPKSPTPGAAKGYSENDGITREAELLGETRILNLVLPSESLVCIGDERLSFGSFARSFMLSFKTCRVHTADVFWNCAHRARDGTRFLIQNAAIPIPKYKISLLPHTRRSVRMETLDHSECRGFLHEAEVLKGIPADCAELLAVFRHVPIEVISRLRFVAENRVIMYSISRLHFPTSTRVHDMAAVRDVASQEIYLIPHRTQFRAVCLN
jgi:hypothetical protein